MIAGRHQSGLWQLVPAAALVGHPMLFAISAARIPDIRTAGHHGPQFAHGLNKQSNCI
jgi:hypothetical protein